MTEGFIFDHRRCVACGACSVACFLENRFSFRPRMIYTYNPEAMPAFPVINLSLACNHCKTAVCMEGCPSNSYFREPLTGAIVIDGSKCIGCRYCEWNCPYDAPKYSAAERITGKCNLCYLRLMDGLKPACATSCPTGALEYGKLTDQVASERVSWFPEKDMKPSIELRGGNIPPLRVIPDSRFVADSELPEKREPVIKDEWSLIAFSFLTTLSVASILTAFVKGNLPGRVGSLFLIVLAGLLSLFHLGKKRRAWMAVMNLRNSPLSREIGLFILYSLLAGVTIFFQWPLLLITSSIAGLILLLSIDAVYIFADRRKSVLIHSGQVFITALIMVSFFTGEIMPFIFIATIKLGTAAMTLISKREERIVFIIRFLRSAFLIISGISMISGISYPGSAVISLFLSGELLDRILFYIDFKPMNINRLINSHIIEAENEKERD